jgi:UDP-2,3-diacylglucosamine pyrophosphatase LpxH
MGASRAGDLEDCPAGAVKAGERSLVVVSDFHMGIGKTGQRPGDWHPTEDFRWPGALRSFLERVSQCADGRADLVIAGDLLELWQPLKHQECRNAKGCTVEEMVTIATTVMRGHPEAISALKAFAGSGENVVHVVPGNHDAALLQQPVWRVFAESIGLAEDRVRLAPTGVWRSSDGFVLVEHGHQIGGDVNRYETWPVIVTREGNEELIVQPWGEKFVQSIFNAEEEAYPTIDNLSPETAGTRFRMADRRLWGSVRDVARLLTFNLFETSIQQKGALLGETGKGDPKWNVRLGRKLGYRLFADSLPKDDPFRDALLADNRDALALRAELDALAADPDRLRDNEVELLCDQIAIRNLTGTRCEEVHLGAAIERTLVPRKRVMIGHLRALLEEKENRRTRVYIYGHTHQLEEAWRLELNSVTFVTVLNSGAFQRVVDEAGFLARAKKAGLTPQEALRRFRPEDLAPCYTAVVVPYRGKRPAPKTVRWLATEDAPGRFVSARDSRCD